MMFLVILLALVIGVGIGILIASWMTVFRVKKLSITELYGLEELVKLEIKLRHNYFWDRGIK